MNENQEILNPTQKNEISQSDSQTKNRLLVLYNDDINSFDYVINCLVEVCNHDIIQAEQCAFITHYNGKCDIKKGDYKSLKPLKENLVNKGLRVTIY
ncbi:MAG: ATP-dependent Clp protease adaptor ClpS [Bacteroidales bacterium]|nr:ATP-dependent Clp protease adaptor ClpS [Bacteroidales bacterium]MDD3860265.1 ATP-dependent Clp protease adaptor ClpS [Bacteroidales bacterium]